MDEAGAVYSAAIDNLPGWLTTVVTRLCLDRLNASAAVPFELPEVAAVEPDPADDVTPADPVGTALHVVVDRLTRAERVFVLHDSFAIDFTTLAQILNSAPAATRELASRARSKIAAPPAADRRVDWRVVDAFLSAASEGKFFRLLQLLIPDAMVVGDPVAVDVGTPAHVEGRDAVAEFFNGAAAAALPVLSTDDRARPGSIAEPHAWRSTSASRMVW